jgi:hypothetical protein
MAINRTQLPEATANKFSTRVIQNLWTGDVENAVYNTWKAGDYRWTSWENSGAVHTGRHDSTADTQALCIKNGARTGKTTFSPESTAPITTTFL